MKIDLRKIPTYCITAEKFPDRQKEVKRICKEIGIENLTIINGPIEKPYAPAVAKTHIMALANEGPVFIIEDDIALTNSWYHTVEIPEDCEALYVGTSSYGMIRETTMYNGCISSSYDDTMVKPYNMLGLHAILYINEDYKKKISSILQDYVDSPGEPGPNNGCDNPIAIQMKNFNILALRKPMFYQNDGHTNEATLAEMNPIF